MLDSDTEVEQPVSVNLYSFSNTTLGLQLLDAGVTFASVVLME